MKFSLKLPGESSDSASLVLAELGGGSVKKILGFLFNNYGIFCTVLHCPQGKV